jgi:NTE family protein
MIEPRADRGSRKDDMTRRALVLGAGGHAAIAWEIGLITGLADAGIDVRDADLFVGTSAGSIVAAQLTSGVASEQVFQRQIDPRLQVDELVPPVDFAQWRDDLMRAKEGAHSATEFLRRIGSLAAAAPTAPQFERRRIIASRLQVRTWPEQRVLVVAVDADSGERCVFERTSDIQFIDAVAASCAVAGIWPAIQVGGRRYIDGGFYSIDNADLAVGADRVLILTLPARVPPLCVASLDAALETLREHDACVHVVHPDEPSQAAFASVGGNLLDPSVREKAAYAGRNQGRTVAARVAPFWRHASNVQSPS